MWVKLDDGFFEHPKVRHLSQRAIIVYLIGLTYSARLLTDGLLDSLAVRVIKATAGADDSTIKELVSARLWDVAPSLSYLIHNWEGYNPCAAEVEAKREAIRAARQAAGRLGGLSKAGKRSSNGVANDIANDENRKAGKASKIVAPYPVSRNPVSRGPSPLPPVVPLEGGRYQRAPRRTPAQIKNDEAHDALSRLRHAQGEELARRKEEAK